MSSHFIPSSISLYADGSIFFAAEPMVSSMTKSSFPSYIFVYSSLRIMFRAFPMCNGPDGNGAILITTFPFSAFGNSFNPSLISRFDVVEFNFENSSSCVSGDSLLTSLMTFWIVGIMSFIFDFSRPSANRPARTAP